MPVTPDYVHCLTDPHLRGSVYEPEADTFLLLEALDSDAEALRALRPRRCVEIGCGSGTPITHLRVLLTASCDAPAPECHAVDVNTIALEAAARTWRATLFSRDGIAGEPQKEPSATGTGSSEDKMELRLHHGDLFAPLEGMEGFDVVLFNPPYVPTSMDELRDAVAQRNAIAAAWCGGPRGRVVVDRFAAQLPRFLNARGVCYIVAIRENDVPDLMETIRRAMAEAGRGSAHVEVVAERYTGEYLKVIRVRCE